MTLPLLFAAALLGALASHAQHFGALERCGSHLRGLVIDLCSSPAPLRVHLHHELFENQKMTKISGRLPYLLFHLLVKGESHIVHSNVKMPP